MSNFNRLLVSLDMLCQDLHEELGSVQVMQNQTVSERYLVLLKNYVSISLELQQSAQDLTEKGFSKAINDHGQCTHLVNKKMLMIQNRLLAYVVDYYTAATKAEQIRHDDFSAGGEIRFDLLTTRAIKSKAQFKTIIRALSKSEYANLLQGTGLAKFDWGREVLL